jgi:UDP-N-acetylglucosamine 2-epimerase (non-hydrolysing)
MKKISFIFGTRPEAIKLGPLVLALKNHPWLSPMVWVTGQHRELLDQVLDVFQIVPDIDMDLMQPDQTLSGFTSQAISHIDGCLKQSRPDMIIAQGDTTTVFCAALCAFYHQIPFGHVEAGLRTWNRNSPFPEEINRVLTSRVTDLHFAPTEMSRQNLLREEVPENQIFVTGNTVIDALQSVVEKVSENPPVIDDLPPELQPIEADGPRIVLITGHRRENFGAGFRNICLAVTELAERYSDVHFVYPVHMNPLVREPVNQMLGQRRNIHLCAPTDYLQFVAMMNRSCLVLTDSGGVQEEAPSLGKPVLVMRDTTERPEAVTMGTVKLVGTDTGEIVRQVSLLLDDAAAYAAMANAVNPYGDGHACGRIIAACERFFEKADNGR